MARQKVQKDFTISLVMRRGHAAFAYRTFIVLAIRKRL